MTIKALRSFYQNGLYFQAGNTYANVEVSANPAYFEVIAATPVAEPKPAQTNKRRPKVAAMEPSEIKNTAMRRKQK